MPHSDSSPIVDGETSLLERTAKIEASARSQHEHSLPSITRQRKTHLRRHQEADAFYQQSMRPSD